MPRRFDNSEADRMGLAVMKLAGVDPGTVASGSVRWQVVGDEARVEWGGIAAVDPDELLAVINGLELKAH